MKIRIPDMSCSHCVASIEKAIIAEDANASVTCDLEGRTATIETTLAFEGVESVLRKIGFEAEVVPTS